MTPADSPHDHGRLPLSHAVARSRWHLAVGRHDCGDRGESLPAPQTVAHRRLDLSRISVGRIWLIRPHDSRILSKSWCNAILA
jgi:hypothetical protein